MAKEHVETTLDFGERDGGFFWESLQKACSISINDWEKNILGGR